MGWFGGHSGGSQRPAAQKLPNAFGWHDMSGNAWEWVQDCWHHSYRDERVLRGGCWGSRALETRFTNLGFRLARAVLF